MLSDQPEQFPASFRTRQCSEFTREFFDALYPTHGTETLRDRILDEMITTLQHVMLGTVKGMFDPDQQEWNSKKTNVPLLAINSRRHMWDAMDGKSYVRSLSLQTDYRAIKGLGHLAQTETLNGI